MAGHAPKGVTSSRWITKDAGAQNLITRSFITSPVRLSFPHSTKVKAAIKRAAMSLLNCPSESRLAEGTAAIKREQNKLA